MLSPGSYHLAVPKGRAENLAFRRHLLSRAAASKHVRAALVESCRRDILFYVSAFAWTFDPRTADKLLPFVTWPVQDKAFLTILDCIEAGRDLVIEKSRDMGASWMSLTVMEWLWHFHRGHSFLMVSRKEDLVDAPGDPDSLFWKVDFIHKHLPAWLRPDTDRRKLHFGNLDNSSTIDGESTTAAAGVGGRRTAMFIDEFSRIEEGYQLLAGTADTTRCRIFNFTPFGTSNAAYKLARRGDVRKLRLHWSEHPEKARGLYRYSEKLGRVEPLDAGYEHGIDYKHVLDGRLRSPWYDGECERRANDREVAQMLDIDYQGSSYQFFDKAMIVSLQRDATPPVWEGDVAFDPDTGRPRGLVPCAGGPLQLWVLPDLNGKLPDAPYGAGMDVAMGSGATNSVLSAVNAKTGEKVAEYTSPFLKPHQMALRAAALGWLLADEYGTPALLAWEIPGPGLTLGTVIQELNYPNIYFREVASELAIGAKVSDRPGWVNKPDALDALLTQYREALSTRDVNNHSAAALEECLDFVVGASGHVDHAERASRDDPTGSAINHGDRVIADALAWKMARQLGAGQPLRKKALAPARPEPNTMAGRRAHREELAKAQAW